MTATLASHEAVALGQPLVSVILPVYQGERIIVGAVRSALNQTFRSLEVVVVDDGSTDGTVAALSTIADPRLRVFSQPNAGTAAARNFALQRSRGQYIALLDSDDRWLPEKIDTELRLLRTAPDPIGIAYSSFYAVDDRGRLLNRSGNRGHGGRVFDTLLDGENFLLPSVCLLHRSIIEDIGGFNVHRYHEDHEFFIRASRRYPVYPTRRYLAVYRQSTAGKCRAILSDYERARDEELGLVADLADTLSPAQVQRLRRNVVRSLYCRFLMYGLDAHARRIQAEVDTASLRGTRKGTLAWISAKSGINLLWAMRTAIQGCYLTLGQQSWRRRLAAMNVELLYG